MKDFVGDMCNLSQGIEEYGIQIGQERGIQIGEERGLQIGERRTILNMEQAGFSMEQIMLATKCSIERIRKVIGESKEEKANG